VLPDATVCRARAQYYHTDIQVHAHAIGDKAIDNFIR
jgi:predicted amidohydrolase YtcJ